MKFSHFYLLKRGYNEFLGEEKAVFPIFYGRSGRREERKESGAKYLEAMEKELEDLHLGRIISVIGRYWSLDREKNWDRIEKTCRMLVHGEGEKVRNSY